MSTVPAGSRARSVCERRAPRNGRLAQPHSPLYLIQLEQWAACAEDDSLDGIERARQGHDEAFEEWAMARARHVGYVSGPGGHPVEELRRRRFAELQEAAIRDIQSVVQPGETLILVDEALWATGAIESRHAVPFTERDGQYWGPPADDRSAIVELERLRAAGAHVIVFVWTSFWWLICYGELHEYLRATYRCASENDLVVAFDLRPPRDSDPADA